jgi:Flp pilus assembly protein TadG
MSIRRLIRNRSGASAAEFALILPLLIILLLGIVDAGRFIWEYNRAEKATQAGARVAVVTQIIPQGVADFKYVGQTAGGVAYLQGDPLTVTALGKVECKQTSGTLGCTCDNAGGTSFCPTLGTSNTAGFDAVVARMQAMYPRVSASKVIVEYRGSGVGYAGDPGGMDISPLVTVKLSGMTFNPLVFFGLVNFTLPPFATSLTAEDSSSTYSN